MFSESTGFTSMDKQASTGWESPTPRSPPRPAISVNPGLGRKKGTACARCRTQKIRCDDQQPSCGNCARVGHACLRPSLANNPDTLNHLAQLETRLRWMEDSLHQVAPEQLEHAPTVDSSLQPSLVTTAVTGRQPDQSPGLSHDPVHNLRQPQEYSRPQLVKQHGQDDNNAIADYPSQGNESLYDSSDSETSPATGTSTQIKPNEPLAHEVGLLSLANSTESKYLGPSSGVPFARLIFSAIPQSQGLSTCVATPSNTHRAERAAPFPLNWVFEVDLQHFVEIYFQIYSPLYPFLDEDMTHQWLQKLSESQSQHATPSGNRLPQLSDIERILSPIISVQFFLIIALGSRSLETRLSTDFASERYFSTAMSRLGSLAFHDSLEGLQIMLLLTLCSLNFVDGPNAWFLVANVIASCLDLGLQRRWVDMAMPTNPQQRQQVELRKTLRSGIFWSTYSLERQLAVVLGRPLTLRDEAIDVGFPGGLQSMASRTSAAGPESSSDSPDGSARSVKRSKIQTPALLTAHYSFRFDQILAEIKLTLHRVVNKPDRFPWPTDLPSFQRSVHQSCDELYNDLVEKLKWQTRRGASEYEVRSLEIKYHQCLMLLHRPSPAIPHPTLDSWRACYNSAVRTVLAMAELQRFCKLNNSWLMAHNIFVCGITFLYCLWINPSLLREVGISTFTSNAEACSSVLKHLGKTWSVAADALIKFERLVQTTLALWRTRNEEHSTQMDAGQSLLSMHQSQWQYNQRVGTGQSGNAGDANLEQVDFFQPNDFPSEYSNIEFGSFHTELGDMSAWFDLDWIGHFQQFGDPSGMGI